MGARVIAKGEQCLQPSQVTDVRSETTAQRGCNGLCQNKATDPQTYTSSY